MRRKRRSAKPFAAAEPPAGFELVAALLLRSERPRLGIVVISQDTDATYTIGRPTSAAEGARSEGR